MNRYSAFVGLLLLFVVEASGRIGERVDSDTGSVLYVASVAALENLATEELANGQAVALLGYYVPGDGGGGTLFLDKTAMDAPDEGCSFACHGGIGRWKRALQDGVSVRQFGAKGDGKTDDTVAIQRALASKVRLIRIDTGVFRVTKALQVLGGNLTIAGFSRDGSVILQSADNVAILKLGGADLSLQSLTLAYARAQPITSQSANAIEFYGLYQSILNNIRIYQANRGLFIPAVSAYEGANWVFSCSISNISIVGYSNRAIDLCAFHGGISGNVLSNIDCIGRDAAGHPLNTNEAIYLSNWGNGVLDQINVETSRPTEPIFIGASANVSLRSIHLEALQPRTDWGGMIHVDGGLAEAENVSIESCVIDVAHRYAAIRLGPGSAVILNGIASARNKVISGTWIERFQETTGDTGASQVPDFTAGSAAASGRR